MRPLLRELLLWLGLALALTAPVWAAPGRWLLGDPAIDVWNHAWGYWFVMDALVQGRMPWHTALVGAPDGGVLYFIDTPGAVAALPITWLFGPAVGYNLTLTLRVALAGLAGRWLARSLAGEGPHTWLGGVAYATMPFLLCELGNGISEVCAVQWLPLTLVAAVQAMRRGRWSDWLLLGLAQGVTSVTTFYYGLCSALVVGVMFGVWGVRGLLRRELPAGLPARVLACAALAAACVLPHWWMFRSSLSHPKALIFRDPALNLQLMAHNAVDPRIYVLPGGFQSVDLAGVYGEPFLHTGYLRLSVVALALYGAARRPALRPWLLLGVFSLVLGLGPYLWWDGGWVKLGELLISLPFDWLRRVLPQVAITHPLRLSLAAQALFCALAAGGAAALAARWPGRERWVLGALALGVATEGAFGSAASWPLPRSDAHIPALYATPGPGHVLDLPVEVGRGMESSRTFWHQTVHHRPIPFTPDVRMGSTRDRGLLMGLTVPPEAPGAPLREVPEAADQALADHLRSTYSLVVLDPELAARAGLDGRYEAVLGALLGPPEQREGRLVWRPMGADRDTRGR